MTTQTTVDRSKHKDTSFVGSVFCHDTTQRYTLQVGSVFKMPEASHSTVVVQQKTELLHRKDYDREDYSSKSAQRKEQLLHHFTLCFVHTVMPCSKWTPCVCFFRCSKKHSHPSISGHELMVSRSGRRCDRVQLKWGVTTCECS